MPISTTSFQYCHRSLVREIIQDWSLKAPTWKGRRKRLFIYDMILYANNPKNLKNSVWDYHISRKVWAEKTNTYGSMEYRWEPSNTYMYRQLCLNTDTEIIGCGKNSVSNKRCWETGYPHTKEWSQSTAFHHIENELQMDQSMNFKSENAEHSEGN